tara:strand:+ start:730 stop:957 length:228 start_codon:yes stop_codon:yes gene_type:complete
MENNTPQPKQKFILNPYALFAVALIIGGTVLSLIARWAEGHSSTPKLVFLIVLVSLIVIILFLFGRKLWKDKIVK